MSIWWIIKDTVPIWNWIGSVESQKKFFFSVPESLSKNLSVSTSIPASSQCPFGNLTARTFSRHPMSYKNDHTLALSHQSFNFRQSGICLSQHVPRETFLTMYIFLQYKTINQHKNWSKFNPREPTFNFQVRNSNFGDELVQMDGPKIVQK